MAESIENCAITVYDDNEVVGSFEMQLKDLFGSNKEQNYHE